jgi:hypothetical protein
MKGTLTGIGAVLGLLLLLVAIGFGSYISAYNYAAAIEPQITAAWDNSQNILAQYGQKVMEEAQIPTMYAADTQKIVTAAITARYGAEGSKAMFQWIKEQNPNLDPSIYRKIQEVIDAGRDSFQNSQTTVIDLVRSYKTNLNYFWKGMWLHMAGYPKIDLNKYQVITTDRAAEVFKTGKEKGPIQLR